VEISFLHTKENVNAPFVLVLWIFSRQDNEDNNVKTLFVDEYYESKLT